MGLPPREERRHPGRTVAGSSSPLLSSSLFSPRAMRLCRWNPTPLNSLYERETLSRPLSPSLSYLLLFHRRRAPYDSPRMQWNLTRSLYNGRYSFIIWTHFPTERRDREFGTFPPPPLSSLSVSLVYILHVLTKVLSTVITMTIWIFLKLTIFLELHKAWSKSE